MKIISQTEREDGGMDMSFDLTDEEEELLFRQGLQQIVGENFKVLKPDNVIYSDNIHKVELTDEEYCGFINYGIITAIKNAAKEVVA